MNMEISTLPLVLGIIFALAATIYYYIMIKPAKRDRALPNILKTVKHLLSTDYLVIEKIVSFFYVLNTAACIFIGFFLLFGKTFLFGLLMILIGPILCRLVYEGSMLMILLIKNVMDINAKLKGNASNGPFYSDDDYRR